MRGIIEIFQQGIKLILKNRKFIWLLWGTNIVFGIILSMPLFYILREFLLHSTYSNKLTFGFDYIWYLQFRELYKTNISEIPYLIYGVVSLYVLIQVFFLGGIISVFNIPKKNHYVDFFYGGVKYWLRFTKILLISLIFYAIAFVINDYLGLFLTYLFSNQEERIIEFILRASRYILLIFLIGIVSIISDYTKISLAVKNKEKVVQEILLTFRFLAGNFNRIFILFFLVAVIGAVGAIFYNILNNFLPESNYFSFFMAFVLQQLLIIFRLFVSMLFSSTEIILFKDINAQIIPIGVEEID